MSELPCPYCGFNCEVPCDTEEKIECPSCRGIFLYIQQSKSNGEIDCRPSPEINDGSRQMSELKVYHCNEWHNEYTEFYLKSEADKVIEELEDKLKVQTSIAEEAWKLEDVYRTSYAEAVKELYEKNKELRHQKYKRCLDKAEMCQARYDEEDARVNGLGASWDYTSEEMKHWEHWHKRWLELAEKFKEGV